MSEERIGLQVNRAGRDEPLEDSVCTKENLLSKAPAFIVLVRVGTIRLFSKSSVVRRFLQRMLSRQKRTWRDGFSFSRSETFAVFLSDSSTRQQPRIGKRYSNWTSFLFSQADFCSALNLLFPCCCRLRLGPAGRLAGWLAGS